MIASGEPGSAMISTTESLMKLTNDLQETAPTREEPYQDRASIGLSLEMMAINGINYEYSISSKDTTYNLELLQDGRRKSGSKKQVESIWNDLNLGSLPSKDNDGSVQYIYGGGKSRDEGNKLLFTEQFSPPDVGRTLQYLYENGDDLRNDFAQAGQYFDIGIDLMLLSGVKQMPSDNYQAKTASMHENFNALLGSTSNVIAAVPLDITPDSYRMQSTQDVSLPGTKTHSSKKYALVIGINNYIYKKKLTNCVNDANTISDLLERYGYNIISLTDENNEKPTKDSVMKTLDMIGKIKGADKTIIYYSGHGEVDDKGKFYMIPLDANNSYSSYISQEDLEKSTKDLKNLAIIIDACKSGAFKLAEGDGRLVIASCRENEPSNEEWMGSLSVFTKNLQNAIENDHESGNKLILQKIFADAQKETIKWTANPFTRQMPEIVFDSTGGTYYLN
jgi:hypothetical protein